MDLDAFCRRLERSLLLPPNSLHPDMELAQIEGFDSMSHIEVILLLDEMYHVQLPADDDFLDNVKRLRDLDPLVRAVR